jgi:pimeloyl-ACP methyl ester carboxylesterase
MSAIILNSEIVHYEVLGRGRPLIFVHGWVGSWQYWIPTMQATSISFRSYAIDLWGFGETSKAADRYSLDSQVNLLESFLNEMGIGKIALVGHGLGAIIAILYASKYPQMVDRVMPISFPFGKEALNERIAAAEVSELRDWLVGNSDETIASRIEIRKTDSQAIQESLENIETANLPLLATQIELPCLLVHGVNDPAISLPNADLMETLSENFHFVIFENSGHYPMLNESNKFNRLLSDFLTLDAGESPRNLQLKEEWKRRVR